MLPISINDQAANWQEHITAVQQAVTFDELVRAAWGLASSLTIWLVEVLPLQRG